MARHILLKRAPVSSDESTAPLAPETSAPALTTQEITQLVIYSPTAGSEYSTSTLVITSAITDPTEYAGLTALAAPTSATSTSQTAPTTINTLSVSPSAKPSHSHTAAIAGGVVGGLLGVILVVALLLFVYWRRKRSRQEQQTYEKPELHSNDITPVQEELEGNRAPRNMLQNQATPSELPANKEVQRNGLAEMT
jgi:hypothetical protein